MTRELELRLMGHAAGDGELVAGDAVAIIGAVKELAYRLTRAAADKAGLGRAEAVVERLAETRVALRGQGSRLVFTIGDPDAFDIDPHAAQVDDALWRIVRGMGDNRRPGGVSDSVAEAVDQLVVALWKAAASVEVVAPRRKPVVLTTRMLDRRPWQRRPGPASTATLHGVLEMVDLHTGRFRLRDADGTATDLVEVPDAPQVAHLVGRRVTAAGVFVRGSATRHHRMEQASVTEPAPVEEPVRVLPGQESFDLGLDDGQGPATDDSAGAVSTSDGAGTAAPVRRVGDDNDDLDAGSGSDDAGSGDDAAGVAEATGVTEAAMTVDATEGTEADEPADALLLDLPATPPRPRPARSPRRHEPAAPEATGLLLDL